VADLLAIQASLLLRAGQSAAALPLIETGLSLARCLGDPHLTARLLDLSSWATRDEGDLEGSVLDLADSLALSREAGDLRSVGVELGNLAYGEMGAGELASARAHLAESLRITRELRDLEGVVVNTFNLGLVEYLTGSSATAATLFAESLELARRWFIKVNIGYGMLGLAMTRSGAAAADWSARLHGAADKTLEAVGETPYFLERELRDADREKLRVAMGGDAFEAGYAAGRALTIEEAIQLALGVENRASDASAADSASGPAR
jgi:hypothetical protein